MLAHERFCLSAGGLLDCVRVGPIGSRLLPNPPPTNMNLKLISCLAASAALSAGSAFGAVSVSLTAATATTAWPTIQAGDSGGGALVLSRIASSGSGVSESLTTSSSATFAQSFQGNGEVLQGFGFLGNGTNASPVSYTVRLIDYGTTNVIDTDAEFATGTPIVTASFSLGTSAVSQIYFDFSGTDAVTLVGGRSYGMTIADPAGGSEFFVRLGGGDSTYAFGTAAKNNPFSTTAFGGLRDANFALYTAVAVPEPSSFAAVCGVVAGATIFLRRRRR